MPEFAVLGAGSWGTALGILLAKEAGFNVRLWEFRPEAASNLAKDRENREFLAGIPYPDRLSATNDLDEALSGAEAVLLVVPAQVTRSVLEKVDPSRHGGKIWIGASKGIENKTLLRMSELTAEVLGADEAKRYVVLSGPSHAEEVARSIPTTVVAACNDLPLAREVQEWFSGPTFRTYASDDVVGVEPGAQVEASVLGAQRQTYRH